MKTKIATALSLIGVLGAGSAAALVNTQILDSGPAEADASAELLAPTNLPASTTSSTQATTSTTSLAPSTTLPASTTSIVTTPVVVPAPSSPAPSGFLTSYNVGPAGTVTVDVQGGRVVLVSTQPAAGWTVTEAENDSDENRVEAKFTDGTTVVEFEVVFVDGQLVPRVESKSATETDDSVPGVTTPNTATENTIDDDGDDRGDDHGDDRDDDGDDDDNGGGSHGGDDDGGDDGRDDD